MTRDEKIEFTNQLTELKRAVVEINGPFAQMNNALILLDAFHRKWLDDEVFANCESCGAPIFESEAESSVMSTEDDCWVCSGCAANA